MENCKNLSAQRSVHFRVTDFVAVIFHKGELLNDQTGVLEPGPKGKIYAKFHSMEEVKKHGANLQQVV